MSMQERWDRYTLEIEKYLGQLSFGGGVLEESMMYSLLNGGKRLRPVLVLAAAEAVWKAHGKAWEEERVDEFMPAAAAVELVHTYSLIHDDLPAMDDDDFRRGKPSNHIKFGEAQAILAGDGLLTFAFQLLARPLPVAGGKQIQVIKELAEASGPLGMVGGQVADMEGEGKIMGLPEIESIHSHKTGALITASIRMGALLAEASEEELIALSHYGQALGLAFQIKDDILDIEGDAQVIGKPVKSDLKQEKATYPALLGLEGAKNYLREKVKEAQAALQILDRHGVFLYEMADYVEKREQ